MSKNTLLQGAVTVLDKYVSEQMAALVDIAVKICVPADVITPVTYARGIGQFARLCGLTPATLRRVLRQENKHRPSTRTTTHIAIAAQRWGLVPAELIQNMNSVQLQSDGGSGLAVAPAVSV